MLSRISPWFLALVFLGLAIAAMVMPLSSDTTPYGFLFDREEAHNEKQRFLHAVADYSGAGREELEPLIPRLRPLEKMLPVTVFLARESGKSIEQILDLRKENRYWLDVVKAAGLENKVLFEGVQGTFPEPYKAAWVEYRMKWRPEISDQQVRDLALLQLAHRITGEPMADIVKQGAKGRTPEQVIAKHKPRKDEQAADGEAAGKETAGKAGAKKPSAKGR